MILLEKTKKGYGQKDDEADVTKLEDEGYHTEYLYYGSRVISRVYDRGHQQCEHTAP